MIPEKPSDIEFHDEDNPWVLESALRTNVDIFVTGLTDAEPLGFHLPADLRNRLKTKRNL